MPRRGIVNSRPIDSHHVSRRCPGADENVFLVFGQAVRSTDSVIPRKLLWPPRIAIKMGLSEETKGLVMTTGRGSVTHWIDRLQAGEEGAVQQDLWNRYFERLVRVAKSRLGPEICRAEDEEDVALSAFHSFFDRVQAGQFPQLRDRTDLWSLLATMTIRKSLNHRRRHRAQKRDALRAVATPKTGNDDDVSGWLEQLADEGPTPEMAVETAEQARRLLGALEKDSLKQVARKKLEGYTNREIAEQLGVIERTVERRLVLIRKTWLEFEESS